MKANKITVIKIGGAGLGDATRFKLFATEILPTIESEQKIIVCSAIKHVTHHLVEIFEVRKNILLLNEKFDNFYNAHLRIIARLGACSKILESFDLHYAQLKETLALTNEESMYAELLQYGERISSMMLSLELKYYGIENTLFDARDYIKTLGDSYKDTLIDHFVSEKLIHEGIPELLDSSNLLITQGFISRKSSTGENSILPLNGSDTSAAFFAHSVRASKMIFLKDVPGICMNYAHSEIDFNNIKANISFEDYFRRFENEKVYPVHPSAISILAYRKIPTRVCSFLYPSLHGTEIN